MPPADRPSGDAKMATADRLSSDVEMPEVADRLNGDAEMPSAD